MAALPATALTSAEHFFLGVERSATDRAWRDRLDARGQARAMTIAQRHGLPELLARVLAGRGVEADEVEAYLDPSVRRLMPDPHVLTAMEAASARIADAVDARREHRHFRRLRRRWRHRFGAARALSAAMRARPDRAYSRPHLRGLRAERRRHPLLRRARRDAAGHRRLRHHQPRGAGRSKKARPRHRGDRSSSGRRGIAAGFGHRQSQPRRRSLRPRPSRRGRSGVPDAGRGQPAIAPARLLDGGARRSPICCRCCIWSRSAPSPTWCRSTGFNRAFVAKGLIALRRREHVGATALDGRRAAVRSARALASRLPARAAHQCRRPHRPRRSRRAAVAGGRPERSRAHRRRARPAQQRAPSRSRSRRWRRPRPKPWPRSGSRKRARWW